MHSHARSCVRHRLSLVSAHAGGRGPAASGRPSGSLGAAGPVSKRRAPVTSAGPRGRPRVVTPRVEDTGYGAFYALGDGRGAVCASTCVGCDRALGRQRSPWPSARQPRPGRVGDGTTASHRCGGCGPNALRNLDARPARISRRLRRPGATRQVPPLRRKIRPPFTQGLVPLRRRRPAPTGKEAGRSSRLTVPQRPLVRP
jgi:hypothetical protein